MHYNNLSGILPNFASNPDIYYARFSYNKLTGTIPGYKNLTKLRYLLINNNQFSAVNDPENLPKLNTIMPITTNCQVKSLIFQSALDLGI